MTSRSIQTILKSESGQLCHRCSDARPKPFIEPALVRNFRVYADFLVHLDRSGMLSWRVGGESLLGIIFVAKKTGPHHFGHAGRQQSVFGSPSHSAAVSLGLLWARVRSEPTGVFQLWGYCRLGFIRYVFHMVCRIFQSSTY